MMKYKTIIFGLLLTVSQSSIAADGQNPGDNDKDKENSCMMSKASDLSGCSDLDGKATATDLKAQVAVPAANGVGNAQISGSKFDYLLNGQPAVRIRFDVLAANFNTHGMTAEEFEVMASDELAHELTSLKATRERDQKNVKELLTLRAKVKALEELNTKLLAASNAPAQANAGNNAKTPSGNASQ